MTTIVTWALLVVHAKVPKRNFTVSDHTNPAGVDDTASMIP